MAANKIIRFGPIAMSATLTTNILNPPTLTGGVNIGTVNTNTYYLIQHIHIVNKTGSAASFSLWIGASGANAAGTEFNGIAKSVPANDYIDWYGNLRLDVADFLVGGASAGATLTFQGEGQIGLV